MAVNLLQSSKQLLTLVGARLPERAFFRNVQAVVNYLWLGHWMEKRGFRFEHRASSREDVFDVVAQRVRDKKVLYLEFGVFQGDSMRYWSRSLKNPEAQLHGFDSFEGLPEVYGSVGNRLEKGAFDLCGGIPTFDDPRVRLFKGWFDQVLPSYTPPDHDALVINMDADLYSSTILVLRHLRPYIKRGVFIYFDNLSQPEHEPKAFDDFVRESGLRFRALCADKTLMQAFFECVG